MPLALPEIIKISIRPWRTGLTVVVSSLLSELSQTGSVWCDDSCSARAVVTLEEVYDSNPCMALLSSQSHKMFTAPKQQPTTDDTTTESNLILARKAISIFVDQNQLDIQKELEAREKIARESFRQLEEAKQIVPALFAEPGDHFVYRGSRLNSNMVSDYGSTYLEYVGRNQIPPVQLEHFARMYSKQYSTPEIGWLVFRWIGGERIDSGLRGACDAWPKECYQYYNEERLAVKDTICIPPAMCGLLWKQP